MLDYIHSYHNDIPLWYIWVTLIVLLAVILSIMRSSISNKIKWCSVALLGEYTIMVLSVTVFFRIVHGDNFGVNLLPFLKYKNFYTCTGEVGREIVSNVCMFVPIGVLSCYIFTHNRFLYTSITAFVISASIEMLQFVRDCGWCETDDLILNVFGAMLGLVLGKILLSLSKLR